jgi:hypothetical protein
MSDLLDTFTRFCSLRLEEQYNFSCTQAARDYELGAPYPNLVYLGLLERLPGPCRLPVDPAMGGLYRLSPLGEQLQNYLRTLDALDCPPAG